MIFLNAANTSETNCVNNKLWSKDFEVFCVALVTYKLTIIYEINYSSANDDVDFKTKANEMSTFFSNCNYSPSPIQSAINRISKISQAKALQPRPKQSTTERTPLVLTYHPHMHRIKQHKKSDSKHIFTSRPLLAYRRDTNLKQPLVRSSLNPILPGGGKIRPPSCFSSTILKRLKVSS